LRRAALGFAYVCACASDPKAGPAPVSTGHDASDTGGGTGGDPPGLCDVDPVPGSGTAASSRGDGGGSGFKFDVGPDTGEGGAFPVDCADAVVLRGSIGCEFWAVDLPNDWRGTDNSPPAAEQQFAVVVANSASLEVAQVAVYHGADTVAVESVSLAPEMQYVFLLPADNVDPTAIGITAQAWRVESDVPVTAYQFNPLDNQVEVYSNDASLLLPTHALDDDYLAVTSDAVLLGKSVDDPDPVKAGAFVAVVATADGTTLDVLPTAPVLPGSTTGIVLQRGEVFHVLSDQAQGPGNLSGTRVLASAPVAVFSGNVAAVEPVTASACCADHLEHQMAPISAWGTAYATIPPAAAEGGGIDPAVYRITAAFDDTFLVYCPARPAGAPAMLSAFQTVSFEASWAFTVRSAESDKPFLVTQFLVSADASANGGPLGDPAMLAVPAIAQYQRKYAFAVPGAYAGGSWLGITSVGRSAVRLDGVELDAGQDLAGGVHDGTQVWFRNVPVEPGAHVVEATEPVGITVIGYDEYVSYGYAGGAGLDVIAVPPPAG
jgi:hypothetical protein